MIATTLHAQVSAVCPIEGISIGKQDDKSTWRIDFKEAATKEQQLAARAALDAFDIAGAKSAEQQAIVRKVTDGDELQFSRMDNAVLNLLDMTPSQRVTWARSNFPTLTQPEQTRIGLIVTMLAAALRPLVR